MLSDASGHTSLLRKFPVAQALIHAEARGETDPTERQPCDIFLAPQQDFCRVASNRVPFRLSDFDVVIEVAPSIHGPTLETLLQQEAICQDGIDTGQPTSIVYLCSQKPHFKTGTQPNGISSGMPQTQTVVEQQPTAAACRQWTPSLIQPDRSRRCEQGDSMDEHLQTTQRTETDGSRSTGLSFDLAAPFRTGSSAPISQASASDECGWHVRNEEDGSWRHAS